MGWDAGHRIIADVSDLDSQRTKKKRSEVNHFSSFLKASLELTDYPYHSQYHSQYHPYHPYHSQYHLKDHFSHLKL